MIYYQWDINIIPSENPKEFKTGVLGFSETRYEDSPLTELFKIRRYDKTMVVYHFKICK